MTHSVATADEQIDDGFWRELKGDLGLDFTPQIFIAMQSNPGFLRNAWALVSEALLHGELHGLTKHMIFVAVARAKKCHYCEVAHSAFARYLGLDPTLVDALKGPLNLISPHSLSHLLQFAQAVARGDHVARLKLHHKLLADGYSPAKLDEAITAVGVASMMSNIANSLVLRGEVDPEFFALLDQADTAERDMHSGATSSADPVNPEAFNATIEEIRNALNVQAVPTLFERLRFNPPFMAAVWGAMKYSVLTGNLDRLTKHLVFVQTARAKHCRYCESAHLSFARSFGATDDMLQCLLSSDFDQVDDKRRLLLRYIYVLSSSRPADEKRACEALVESEYSAHELQEACYVSAVASLCSALATGMELDTA